jgi:PAP_fibrillin
MKQVLELIFIVFVTAFFAGSLAFESSYRLRWALHQRIPFWMSTKDNAGTDVKPTATIQISSKLGDFFSPWLRVARAPKSESAIKTLKSLIYEATAACQPNGLQATQSQRTRISDLVSQIEQLNPTARPAYSPLMNGFWRMLYTDFSPPAASAGKLGPFVGDVFQDLDSTNSVIRNVLRISLPPIRGQLTATQRIRDPKTWYA